MSAITGALGVGLALIVEEVLVTAKGGPTAIQGIFGTITTFIDHAADPTIAAIPNIANYSPASGTIPASGTSSPGATKLPAGPKDPGGAYLSPAQQQEIKKALGITGS